MKKKDKLEKVKRKYRKFRHNLEYKINYSRNVIIILIIIILLDLIVLYLVW